MLWGRVETSLNLEVKYLIHTMVAYPDSMRQVLHLVGKEKAIHHLQTLISLKNPLCHWFIPLVWVGHWCYARSSTSGEVYRNHWFLWVNCRDPGRDHLLMKCLQCALCCALSWNGLMIPQNQYSPAWMGIWILILLCRCHGLSFEWRRSRWVVGDVENQIQN